MNIGLCGLGKSGSEFLKYVLDKGEDSISLVLCRDNSPTAGKTVRDVLKVYTEKDIPIVRISDCYNIDNIDLDVIVDFSNRDTTLKLLDFCISKKNNLVICPNDFSNEEIEAFKDCAIKNNIGIVYAPTLTVGVNMIIDFVSRLSSVFEDFSFDIVERHSKNKSEPTKTAEIIKTATNKDNTRIESVRLDGYVGIHEVTATNGIERITIEHESFSRKAFANGALIAANYIQHNNGFYMMHDIIAKQIHKD